MSSCKRLLTLCLAILPGYAFADVGAWNQKVYDSSITNYRGMFVGSPYPSNFVAGVPSGVNPLSFSSTAVIALYQGGTMSRVPFPTCSSGSQPKIIVIPVGVIQGVDTSTANAGAYPLYGFFAKATVNSDNVSWNVSLVTYDKQGNPIDGNTTQYTQPVYLSVTTYCCNPALQSCN